MMYGERIRTWRNRCGMSQQTLGRMLGISAVAVGKWERGQSQPDIHTLTRLADIFGTTIDDLCGRNAAEDDTSTGGNLHLITRAFRQLTPDEQEKYLAVGRALFSHAFGVNDQEESR